MGGLEGGEEAVAAAVVRCRCKCRGYVNLCSEGRLPDGLYTLLQPHVLFLPWGVVICSCSLYLYTGSHFRSFPSLCLLAGKIFVTTLFFLCTFLMFSIPMVF